MMLVLAVLVTVSGVVAANDGSPLPGVTVTLPNATPSRTTVTDANGRYSFVGLSEGTHDLRYELEGLEPGEQRFTATEARTTVPAQQMVVDMTHVVTLSCGSSPCSTERPVTAYELPLCDDYVLHTAWIEAAQSADRSAVAILQRRYSETTTFRERHRLAGALLGRVADDREIWEALYAAAETCVLFPRGEEGEHSAAYHAWAAQHGVAADEHWWMSYDALGIASSDPRSRALLLKALGTGEDGIIAAAIAGLGEQHYEESLPAIEKAILRAPEESRAWVATALFWFGTVRADVLALQYLEGTDRDEYLAARAERNADTLAR